MMYKTLRLIGVACLLAVCVVVFVIIGNSRIDSKIDECMAEGDSYALCKSIILRNRF